MKKLFGGIVMVLFFMVMGLCLPVSANASEKAYSISTGNTRVYSDTGLTNGYGTIFDSDEVNIDEVSGDYLRVTYPTSKGSKSGYVPAWTFMTKTGGWESGTARAKVTTYKRPGGASYGYISAGDYVDILGTSGDYTQVRYPVSNGHKYAFVSTADCNNHIYSVPVPVVSYDKAYIVTTPSGLILRDGPSTGCGKILTMPHNAILQVASIDNGWAHANYNGQEGYCSAQYIAEYNPGGGSNASGDWQMPMTNAYVCGNNWLTYYSARPDRPYHLGLDIASGSGDANVYAAASGTVAATGYNNANGNFVIIRHSLSGKTVYSFYCHLSSYCVGNGQNVGKGERIGVFGNTGSSSAGSHLHFAIADKLSASGGYYGYGTASSGNSVSYSGTTFYNPHYVVEHGMLP